MISATDNVNISSAGDPKGWKGNASGLRAFSGISVVVPVYNKPSSLNECLRALSLQQTDEKFEVVVVDDGSTENLEPVKAEWQSCLNLKWVVLKHNQGPAAARNAGIQASKGDIILFTDSDCKPEPGWLKALSDVFTDGEVSGAKGVYKTDQKDLWARLAQLEFEERYDLLESHADIDFIDSYSAAFRKKDLTAVGGFDTSFPKPDNEDVDLSFRIKKLGGKFKFVRQAVVWHSHREGFWNYFKLKTNRGFWRMKVYDKHPGKAGMESYTPKTLKAQMLLMILLPVVLVFPGLRRTWFLGWLGSCFPLFQKAWGKENDLLPWIPVLTLTRAFALSFGIIMAFGPSLLPRLQNWFQSEILEKNVQSVQENRRS